MKPTEPDREPGGKPEPGPSSGNPIQQLDADSPLALFPVRLATRFVTSLRQTRPHALRIRIFPDPIIIEAHTERLTDVEAALGSQFWTEAFRASGDPVQMDSLRTWLIDQVGRPRASWIGRATRPKNLQDIGRGVKPDITKPEIGDEAPHVVARLLPERWAVQVRTGNEFQRTFWSDPVDRTAPITAAPQLADVPPGGIREFLDGQDLAWRHDFDAAVAAGMALEIPVEGEARERGFSELIVFGVNNGDDSAKVERLLQHHRYDQGLRLIAQGTATNNTDDARVIEPSNDVAELSVNAPSVPQRTPGKSPADLFREPQASRAGAAFGLRSLAAFTGDALADVTDTRWAAAMSQLIWPGLNAQLLDGLLATDPPIIDADDRRWVRDWFFDYVSGRALLPTLGVGDQPYGMLPVVALPDRYQDPADTPHARFAQVVAEWEGAWTGSMGSAALDPLGADGRSDDDEAAEVAAVLGAVPHPTAFRARPLTDDRRSIVSGITNAGRDLAAMIAALPGPSAPSLQGHFRDHLARVADVVSAYGQLVSLVTGPDSLRFWMAANIGTFRDYTPNPVQAIVDHIDDVMEPMLRAHDGRVTPQRLIPELGSGKLPDPDDPDLFYANYGDIAPAAPELALLGSADPGDLIEQLSVRRRMVVDRLNGADFEVPEGPRALLFVLIDQSIRLGSKEALGSIAEGLDELIRVVEGDLGYGGAVDELRRMLRETLGLFTHRHDAWRTSLAAARLAELRAKQPIGVQTGMYGWVLDLHPDDGSPDTDGFIHAPSLDHAAAAAMLRSAWRGLGNSVSDVPFAVDLSSDRVRRATWLLDGMRNGHELDELLGQRFERRLHDAGLDAWIADIRVAVLAAVGRAGEPASAIVDGLALASAYRSGSGAVHDAVEAVRKSAPQPLREPLLAVLDSAEADFDAVADLLTTQAVMSLIQGDTATSAAALAAIGSNPGGIPRISAADVSTSGNVISHRVSALLEPEAVGSTLAGACSPTLDAWLRSMLPPIDDVPVHIEWLLPDGSVDESDQLSLGQLGIGATHLVSWCTPTEEPFTGRLAMFVAAIAGTVLTDREVRVSGRRFEAVVIAAAALSETVGMARSITPADLVDSTAPADTEVAIGAIDAAELVGRVNAAAAVLRSLADRTLASHSRARFIADLELFDSGAARALMASWGDDAEARAAAAERLRARADQLDDVDRADVEAMQRELQGLLGSKLPILPVIDLPDDALARLAADGKPRLGDAARFRTWMLATGRVRDGVGALDQSVLITEALTDRDVIEPLLFQMPALPGVDDGWAGLDLPDFAAARTRLCLISVTDATSALQGGRVSGLLFDSWTETIPGAEAVTGVALNFDSPSSRAPQAVLLAVAPSNRRWSTELLVGTLSQTLRAAQNRAVGPETLEFYGHILPAVFVDDQAELLTRRDRGATSR